MGLHQFLQVIEVTCLTCLDIHSFGYTRNQSFFLKYGEQFGDVLDIIQGKRRNKEYFAKLTASNPFPNLLYYCILH